MASFKIPAALALFKLTALLSFITSLPIASATFTIARCCTLAARTEFQKYWDAEVSQYPWQVCNFNTEIEYGTNVTFQSITKPLWWVKEFCPGTQLSNTRQWLQPLAAYISPYIGLLLLCPIGETEQDEKTKKTSWESPFRTLVATLKELVSILGDPASAISGAASEIYADAVALWNISSLAEDKQRSRWVAALAGALKFSLKTDWSPGLAVGARSESKTLLKGTTTPTVTDAEVEALTLQCPDDEETSRAISLCISARASFASTILIPVVLTLAVTAATFYDANANKGDKDTGLALAYCIWYSWILVPAVAGNCFATVISPDLARRAFKNVMEFGEGKRVMVALRGRHVNNQYWGNWLRRQDRGGKRGGREFEEFKKELKGDIWFWVRFFGWNMMGWCVVAVSCGAGAAIAWTTPTVGLGCRSFNFIVYGILAFVNAGLQVLYSWLKVRDSLEGVKKEGATKGWMFTKPTLVGVIKAVYWFLVCFNALVVMALGTVFHLVGVYRTCWCDRITLDNSVMIELNSKTAEAYDNAQKYWISTAYVVFSIMTLICLLGVVFRQVISRRMDAWMEREQGDDKEISTGRGVCETGDLLSPLPCTQRT